MQHKKLKKKILSVFIGRFSPFHDGHANTLQIAEKDSDAILILIGSSHRS